MRLWSRYLEPCGAAGWRTATQTIYQALIDAELTVISAGPWERSPARTGATQRVTTRTLTRTAGIWSWSSRSCPAGELGEARKTCRLARSALAAPAISGLDEPCGA